MSEELNENLNVEELSAEDRKKAINLQDLVYVKKYIDMAEERLDIDKAKVLEEVEQVKNEMIEEANEVMDACYKKTDTVEDAKRAENSQKVNGLEILQDENGVLTINGLVIPYKKLIFDGYCQSEIDAKELTIDGDIPDGSIFEIVYAVNDGDKQVARFYLDESSGDGRYHTIPYVEHMYFEDMDDKCLIGSFDVIINVTNKTIKIPYKGTYYDVAHSDAYSQVSEFTKIHKVVISKVYMVVE